MAPLPPRCCARWISPAGQRGPAAWARTFFNHVDIARVGLPRGNNEVANDGDEADARRHGIVHYHALYQRIGDALKLLGLVDNECLVEQQIGDVASAGDDGNDKRPAEAHPTEREPLIQTVSALLELAQYLGLFGREPWRHLALLV